MTWEDCCVIDDVVDVCNSILRVVNSDVMTLDGRQ